MAKNVTRWSPDTCGCVIEYETDDTETDESKKHVHHATIKSCPAHSKHHGKPEHLTIVFEENRRKNNVLAQAAEVAGVDLGPTKDKVKNKSALKAFDSEAEKLGWEKMILDGMQIQAQQFVSDYKYSFDTDRKLHVSHSSLKDTHKVDLQNMTNLKHGNNKVIIE
jgi:hypothetical protein